MANKRYSVLFPPGVIRGHPAETTSARDDLVAQTPATADDAPRMNNMISFYVASSSTTTNARGFFDGGGGVRNRALS